MTLSVTARAKIREGFESGATIAQVARDAQCCDSTVVHHFARLRAAGIERGQRHRPGPKVAKRGKYKGPTWIGVAIPPKESP